MAHRREMEEQQVGKKVGEYQKGGEEAREGTGESREGQIAKATKKAQCKANCAEKQCLCEQAKSKCAHCPVLINLSVFNAGPSTPAPVQVCSHQFQPQPPILLYSNMSTPFVTCFPPFHTILLLESQP